jgi:hypothetical protein
MSPNPASATLPTENGTKALSRPRRAKKGRQQVVKRRYPVDIYTCVFALFLTFIDQPDKLNEAEFLSNGVYS